MFLTLLALVTANPADLDSRDFFVRDAATRRLSTPIALPLLLTCKPGTEEGRRRVRYAMGAALPYEWRLAWRYLPLLCLGETWTGGSERDVWLRRIDDDGLYQTGWFATAWYYVKVQPPTERQMDYDHVLGVVRAELLRRLTPQPPGDK